jgi:hypothetical protein
LKERTIAGKLDVRRLVEAHRHNVGLVQNDVRRHQDGIADQPVVHIVRLQACLLFERRQVRELPQRRHHRQDGVQLGHFRERATGQNDRLIRPDAGRQEVEDHLAVFSLEAGVVSRVVSVEIDHAVDAVVVGLQGDVVLDRPQVVAQVLPPRRARPGEDPAPFRSHLTIPFEEPFPPAQAPRPARLPPERRFREQQLSVPA